MALILNIETATKNCSVSISRDEHVIDYKELNNGNYSHAEKLHVFIDDLLKQNHINPSELDAIAVSKGPGSYTGLRIGVSAAKGLCFALEIPLIAIETLEILSYSHQINTELIIPMIDARRMEVYTAVYNNEHTKIREIKAEIITENSFSEELSKNTITLIGDGAAKCKDVITHENIKFITDTYPSAKNMATISFKKFTQKDFKDVAYFEPFYLKDFIVTPAKKKV